MLGSVYFEGIKVRTAAAGRESFEGGGRGRRELEFGATGWGSPERWHDRLAMASVGPEFGCPACARAVSGMAGAAAQSQRGDVDGEWCACVMRGW